jgi:hypothetical protein
MNNHDHLASLDFTPDPLPSTQAMRKQNRVLGLTAIAKFGWLRPYEIGNVLWPQNKTRRIAAERVVRQWLDEGLVIQRMLPHRFGHAYVLSHLGADFVDSETEYGYLHEVRSGKKIGDHIRQVGNTWVPSHSWRHDLLSNGFLTLVMGFGGRVVSELELRRESGGKGKIPDGLYSTDTLRNEWFAVETERAGKWSINLRTVSKSIVNTALRETQVCGRIVRGSVVLYEDPSSRHWDDQYRPIVNHLDRIARRCNSIVPDGEHFKLVGIPLLTSGGSVVDIADPIWKRVGSSDNDIIDQSIYTFRWDEYQGTHRLQIPESSKMVVKILMERDQWLMKVLVIGQAEDIRVSLNDVQGVRAARQMAIKALLKIPMYRDWAGRNIQDLRKRLQD